MAPNINPSINSSDADSDKPSPTAHLAGLVEPVEDAEIHRNPRLREQFRTPRREEKRLLMKLRNHHDASVTRNAGVILAFMTGLSTHVIADHLALCEKQVRRLIQRWNVIGMAALPADDQPLPEPTWTDDELRAQYEQIQSRYNEQLVELMRNRPTDPVEFLRFEQRTLELRNQIWDELHQVNVKLIVEDPAIIEYACDQLTKLNPTGWYLHDRKRRQTIERLRREMNNVGKRKAAKLFQRIEKHEKQLINKLEGWELDQKATSKDLPLTLATGGTVKVTTPYYLLIRTGRGRPRDSRGSSEEGNGIHPVLDLFGFRDKMSLLFCSMVGRHAAQHSSYEEAARWLQLMNIQRNPTQVKVITDRLAEDAVDARELWLQTGIPPPGSPDETAEGVDMAVMGDGGRIKIRTDHAGKKKANGYRNFESDWRQVMEGCVFEFEVTGEGADQKVRKNTRGQVQEFACGTMYSYHHLYLQLLAHLKRIEIWKAGRIVMGGDGDPDLWEKVLLPLVDALDLWDRVEFFVDYYHATEHISAFSSWKKNWDEGTRTRWNEQMRGVLLNQGGHAVVDEMRQKLKGVPKSPARKELERELNYFVEREERMRYPKLRAMGLPIGTGSMESLIKRTNNRRLKGNAVHWKEECAHGMLHLVCVAVTDRWEEMLWNVGFLRAMRIIPPVWERQGLCNWNSGEIALEAAV